MRALQLCGTTTTTTMTYTMSLCFRSVRLQWKAQTPIPRPKVKITGHDYVYVRVCHQRAMIRHQYHHYHHQQQHQAYLSLQPDRTRHLREGGDGCTRSEEMQQQRRQQQQLLRLVSGTRSPQPVEQTPYRLLSRGELSLPELRTTLPVPRSPVRQQPAMAYYGCDAIYYACRRAGERLLRVMESRSSRS